MSVQSKAPSRQVSRPNIAAISAIGDMRTIAKAMPPKDA